MFLNSRFSFIHTHNFTAIRLIDQCDLQIYTLMGLYRWIENEIDINGWINEKRDKKKDI